MDHVRTYVVTITKISAGYRAVCPGLPACAATASTSREALEHVEDDIRNRVRDALARRRPLPVDRTSVKFIWLDADAVLV